MGMEESMSFEAVLFDFSDTLFWRNSAERLAVLLADAGTEVDAVALASVWADVKRERAQRCSQARGWFIGHLRVLGDSVAPGATQRTRMTARGIFPGRGKSRPHGPVYLS